MLKYLEWKKLNESFMGTIPLGVGNSNSLGVRGGLGGTDVALEESKKKSKKRMHNDDDMDDDDDDMDDKIDNDMDNDDDMDDDDGHEHVCKCGKMMKKKSKKYMNSDFEDEDKDEKENLDKKLLLKNKDKDEEDDDMDEKDDDESMEKNDDMDKKDVNMMKKKMKKKMNKDEDVKKSKKKMKEAYLHSDREWVNSVKSMMAPQNFKNGDGWTEYQEDALIPPSDANANVTESPGPGDVGYAPQSRIGTSFGNDF